MWAHTIFGTLLQVQQDRSAAVVHSERNPQTVGAVLRLPAATEIQIGGIDYSVERREVVVATALDATGMALVALTPEGTGDPGDQIRRAVGHFGLLDDIGRDAPDIGHRDAERPLPHQRPARGLRQPHRALAIDARLVGPVQAQFHM
nr:hypothetical protein [Nocardia albiluteola]